MASRKASVQMSAESAAPKYSRAWQLFRPKFRHDRSPFTALRREGAVDKPAILGYSS